MGDNTKEGNGLRSCNDRGTVIGSEIMAQTADGQSQSFNFILMSDLFFGHGIYYFEIIFHLTLIDQNDKDSLL